MTEKKTAKPKTTKAPKAPKGQKKPTPTQFKKIVDDFNELILNLDEKADYELLKPVWEDLYSLKENLERKITLFRQEDAKKELNRMFKV